MNTTHEEASTAKYKLASQNLAEAAYGITKGTNGFAIKVNVRSEELREKFPATINGVEIVVEVTGKVKAQ